MKKEVIITITMEVDIPEDKHDEILGEFREVMSPTSEMEEVYKHIGWSMARDRYSGQDFVEGVGSLKERGIKCKEVDDFIDVEDTE
jgi:hypothetical protein